MIAPSPRPYVLGACIALTFILLLSLRTRQETSSRWLDYSDKSSVSTGHERNSNYVSATSDKKLKSADTTSELGRSSNGSLGFERVFVIGLRERSYERDAISLSASLTGFRVEFFDGMRGEDVSVEAKPPVERNLASAFIMEDDVDWDIRLLTQLPEFAKGIRTLSNIPLNKRQHSPYGDDWDVLWPGHCGDELPSAFHKDAKDEIYIIANDETVAPKSVQALPKTLARYPEKTRIVHKAGAPVCTSGYGISYRGAQKILMALAVKGGHNLAIDNAIALLCRDGFLDMKCFSVEPQLFQHHRPAGAKNKDSDIDSLGEGDAKGERERRATDVIVWSARLNFEQMVMGRKDYVTQ
ncbi:hypothetical protein SS1G_09576 [Sclerotinia sclerotiorum 1980 UF-70]|uniref:Glycosyl transferase 64 domain-containing protein n=1 Tax=Sclerotinia sclerotiorum (strain ATCC 18683 / 1980 / Ss-1) TaxID=665079 RepID=A7EW67_SCLS1|nr:hypothetical protein SS1G_09576 [Sclerotinia sclerotiorum 1980 UF-70]EDN93709.1 hypothetical protein SS1G_09576 [Sclerotinia sclerotiorum 1980 UF-70]